MSCDVPFGSWKDLLSGGKKGAARKADGGLLGGGNQVNHKERMRKGLYANIHAKRKRGE